MCSNFLLAEKPVTVRVIFPFCSLDHFHLHFNRPNNSNFQTIFYYKISKNNSHFQTIFTSKSHIFSWYPHSRQLEMYAASQLHLLDYPTVRIVGNYRPSGGAVTHQWDEWWVVFVIIWVVFVIRWVIWLIR